MFTSFSYLTMVARLYFRHLLLLLFLFKLIVFRLFPVPLKHCKERDREREFNMMLSLSLNNYHDAVRCFLGFFFFIPDHFDIRTRIITQYLFICLFINLFIYSLIRLTTQRQKIIIIIIKIPPH